METGAHITGDFDQGAVKLYNVTIDVFSLIGAENRILIKTASNVVIGDVISMLSIHLVAEDIEVIN